MRRKGGSGVEEEDQDGDGAGRWKEGIIRVGGRRKRLEEG